MPSIPNAADAVLPTAKLRYLLDASHPQNVGKAAFFTGHGFRLDALAVLERALGAHIHGEAAVIGRPDGVRYLRDGPLETPDGRNPRLLSVWQIDVGDTKPRLITAYPRRRQT